LQPCPDYSDFDSLLQKYVSGNNVKYGQLLEAKDKLNFRIDEDQGILYLSSFLDWLRKNKNIEEPDMLNYIKLYYDGQIKEEYYSFDIEYYDYNWQLNDITKLCDR
jgi:hypothetical protein